MRLGGSHPTTLNRLTNQFAGIAEMLFVKHVFAMGVDGLFADVQDIADFLAEFAFNEKGKNLLFTSG